MGDDYESDAIRLLEFDTHENRIVDSLSLIESTVEWYDQVAAAFLLYDSPQLAFDKIAMLREGYLGGHSRWRQVVFTPLLDPGGESQHIDYMWRKVVEVLHLLKQYRLLNLLEVQIYPVYNHLDLFRLKLFNLIDSLSEEDTLRLIDEVNSRTKSKQNNPSWCVEMQFLRWIQDGEISEGDCSLIAAWLGGGQRAVCPGDSIQNREGHAAKSASPPPKVNKFEVTRGLCIIINQMSFGIHASLPPELRENVKENLEFRFGSDVDRDKLIETFKMLGHDVEFYQNLDRQLLLSTIDQISRYDFENYDALVVCVLSHGERGVVFSADSIPIDLDEIKSFFDGQHCRSLIDKPKLFFLQACQGNQNQRIVYNDYVKDGNEGLPAVSNFFEAWATVPGFSAYRSALLGSVFIGELCCALQTYGHTESLLDLMAIVNDKVSRWFAPDGTRCVRKQIPNITYSLTRGLQFKRSQEDKFVDGVVDQLERELLELIVRSAAVTLWQSDRSSALKLLDLWGALI